MIRWRKISNMWGLTGTARGETDGVSSMFGGGAFGAALIRTASWLHSVFVYQVLAGCSFSARLEPPREPFIWPAPLCTGPDSVRGCLEGRWRQIKGQPGNCRCRKKADPVLKQQLPRISLEILGTKICVFGRSLHMTANR